LRLRISTAAESIVRSGHPWIFASSIREQNREGEIGELGIIYDRNNRFLAAGLYDPQSPIRVRILHQGKPAELDAIWWIARLRRPLALRRELFPEGCGTTGFRWINGESDGWPGIVLDGYAQTLALKVYTLAWLPRLAEIIKLIVAELAPAQIVLRLSRNIQNEAVRIFSYRDGQRLLPKCHPDEAVVFLENGLRFEADVIRGQKTGFFLDQRGNRARVKELAAGRKVLNTFSFSGGFSVYAASGGAASVCDLDMSGHALASGGRNFELNKGQAGLASVGREVIQADAFEWLSQSPAKDFDLIVLDPPSFARREAEKENALGAYNKLASLALARLSKSGILAACSCSAHVPAPDFFAAVRAAAEKIGRPFLELETTFHEPDHPAAFPEAEYLKTIYLRC
jgi:23S rRNA (cytosine1962-C5)-methyltransferase